jgi:hypothetical protein
LAGKLDLPPAHKRTPYLFGGIRFEGYNFTGATLLMQIRHLPGDTGTPVISLSGASAGTQGLSITVLTVDDVTSTHLTIQIDEGTMEALPLAAPASAPLELYYDLHITPSGGVKQVWLEGAFIVKPGVSI